MKARETLLLTILVIVAASCASFRSAESRSRSNPVIPWTPDLHWKVLESESSYYVALPDGSRVELGDDHSRLLTSSCSMDPVRRLTLDGVKYAIALAGAREFLRIKYIETSDPAFLSPDGVSITSTYRDLQAVGAGPLKKELGWACYVCLPSGWAAAVSGSPSDESCSTIGGSSVVRWFFQKASTCVGTV